MSHLCTILAAALVILFSAVNLFLPYALLVIGIGFLLAFSCGLLRSKHAGAGQGECLFGCAR